MISVSISKALTEWHPSIALLVMQEALRILDLTPLIPALKPPEVEIYGGTIE